MEQAWILYFNKFFGLFSTFSPPHVRSSQGNQQMQLSSLEEWRIIHRHIIIEKRKACQQYASPPSGCTDVLAAIKRKLQRASHFHLSFRICANCERYAVRKEKANQTQVCLHPSIHQFMYHIRLPNPECRVFVPINKDQHANQLRPA
jgi:hypothetical protein